MVLCFFFHYTIQDALNLMVVFNSVYSNHVNFLFASHLMTHLQTLHCETSTR